MNFLSSNAAMSALTMPCLSVHLGAMKIRLFLRAFLLAFAFLFAHTEAIAQEAMAAFASPVIGNAKPSLRYQTLGFPSERVLAQPSNFADFGQTLALSIPVWQNSSDEITFQASVRSHFIATGAILPTTGNPFPKNLSDVRFGPTWRHKFQNSWITGISVQGGSASDVPFGKYDDSEIMANWFLRIPNGDGGAWIAFLNYSNNRDFANHIPIPGFGFVPKENRLISGMVGVPVIAATLLSKSKVNLAITYLPLLNITGNLGYEPIPPIRIFAEFKWSNESYFRSGQQDKALRLFLVDKRIYGGLRLWPSKWAELRLSSGFSFDRCAFESKSVYKNRDYNRLDFGSSPFAMLELRVRMARSAK